MTIASKFPTDIFERNRRRCDFSMSFDVATSIFASGKNRCNSSPNCATTAFGTTYIGLVQAPMDLRYIPAAPIAAVFPAPTSCAIMQVPVAAILAMTFFW